MNIYKPLITEFANVDQLYREAESLFIDTVLSTVGESGVSRVAFSGGNTPLPLYEKLALNPVIDWSKIEIFQTDERYVNSDSDDSNQKHLIKSMEPALSELREFNVFNTDLPIEMTVQDYSEKLQVLDGPYFDFTILGVGPDGHIASLFPGGKYLKHQDSPIIQTNAPREFAVTKRTSLTIESILNSTDILLIITGEDKKDILGEMLEGEKSATEFPVKFLLAHPRLRIYTSFGD